MAKDSSITPRQSEETALSKSYENYVWLHDLIACLTFVAVLFVFFLRVVQVNGPSMTPTLLDRDAVVLLSNFLYGEIETGDVVVLRNLEFDDQPIVKRVIAKGGQTVDIDFDAGTVSVDGVILDEPYINEPTYLNYSNGQEYPLTVPEGKLFVLGDNRNHSADSRYAPIGLCDERYVLGKVLLTIWPLSRFGAYHG